MLVIIINPAAQLLNDLVKAGYYTYRQAAQTVDYYLKTGRTLDGIRTLYQL